MPEMEPNDVRMMVLNGGAIIAHEVIESVESCGLSSGFKEDSIEVAGIKWELTAVYFTKTGFIQMSGQPVGEVIVGAAAEHGDAFGDDGSFNINLPKSWLPTVKPEEWASEQAMIRR